MKYSKMFALVGVAAVALVAVVATGSASAAVLCKNNTTTNGCSAIYPKGTFVHLQLVKNGIWTLENAESATIITSCTTSTFESSTDNQGGEGTPVTFSAEVGKYKWAGCGSPTSTVEGGKYEIEWIAGTDNGTLKVSNFQVRVETLFGPCIWGTGAEADYGTVTGGTPATTVVNNVTLKYVAGMACAKTAKMRGTYEFTTPNPMYIAKK